MRLGPIEIVIVAGILLTCGALLAGAVAGGVLLLRQRNRN